MIENKVFAQYWLIFLPYLFHLGTQMHIRNAGYRTANVSAKETAA